MSPAAAGEAPHRPAHDHCTVVMGVLWVLRSVTPRRDLLERFGSWRTVHSRFRLQRARVWDRQFRAVDARIKLRHIYSRRCKPRWTVN